MARVSMEPNSDSYKATMELQQIKEANKSKKVIKDSAIIKKKPLSERFVNAFLAEDLENVFDYVWDGVIIPKLKDFVFELIDSTANGILYGTGSVNKKSRRVNGGTNYNSIYNTNYSYGNNTIDDFGGSRKLNYNNIYLKNRDDANDVLEDLRAAIEQFGMVSIYELFDRIGKTAESDYTYQNYGWKDLRNAGVRYTRNGYLLELPKPVYLGER